MNPLQPVYRRIAETDTYILIEDLALTYQSMSVTNGAEKVIKDLFEELGGRKLYYIDTEGRVDQLAYDQAGEFTGFISGYQSLPEFKKGVRERK